MSNKIEKRYKPSAEFRFWLYDPEGEGMVYFSSAEDRDNEASEAIEGYLDETWSEEVENVSAGEVTHLAMQTNRVDRPKEVDLDDDGYDEDGDYWESDCDYKCKYELLPITPNFS